VLSSGNVGIGTTAPSSILHLNGTLGALSGGLAFGDGDTGLYESADDVFHLQTAGSDRVAIDSSGNVGIGTTSPSQKLEVNGKVQIDDLTTAGGASAVYSVGGVLTTAVSSGRFKENITPYEDVLTRVGQLSAVHFTWKPGTATPGQSDFGFIAEDAAKLFPELATYEADGTTIRGLKYDKLPILLTKAIQEQQKEIDSLKLALGPDGSFSNASSTLELTQSGGLFDWLVKSLNSLGLAIKDGVASLKEIVVSKFTAQQASIDQIKNKQIETEQICVKDSSGNDICLTGDQLKDLINRAGSSATITQTFTPNPEPATTTESAADGGVIEDSTTKIATTTEEISQ